MKLRLILAASLVLASCSPEVYNMYLDVRRPSTSGLDLRNKSIAVVSLDSQAPADSLFGAQLSGAFGSQLDEDYFGGNGAVGIFNMPAPDSIGLDVMRNLVMDTGQDVVFLLDPVLGEVTEGTVPIAVKLYVYDSMGDDAVSFFSGKTLLLEGDVPASAPKLAERMARRFKSVWAPRLFQLYYYGDIGAEKWEQAIVYAEQGKYKEAVDIWTGFLTAANAQKRACASYNIAVAFYLKGDMNMALRWLDYAEKLENVPLAVTLRKRINESLEK